MAYSSGWLKDMISIQNRTEAATSRWGVDGTGIQWESAGKAWASVDWVKGKSAMNVGALDAYTVVMVRMRWTDRINMRSRVIHHGITYQIVPETFHEDRQANTIQFHAQALVNKDSDEQTCCNNSL